MAYLSKKDAEVVIKELSKNSNAEIKSIIKKLKSPEKKKGLYDFQNKHKQIGQNKIKEREKA